MVNGADTAWILTATALVLFMTLPGLALFYAGLVRARNILSVLMQCVGIAALMSVLWLIAGYSLAFAEGTPWVGSLSKMMLAGVERGTVFDGTGLPESLFFMFQMTFAIITPALIVGAFVERIKFSAVMLFSALWLLLVYAPVTHWVWGGGWLGAMGVKDFAGGIVVHVTAGVAAIVMAIMLGARSGFPSNCSTAARPVDGDGRCLDAVGRLVRIQCRQRAVRRSGCRHGHAGHARFCCYRHPCLDCHRARALWQVEPRGCGHRHHCRPCHHHPGIGLRRSRSAA
jgi:ammonia channel protein AmtB